MLNWMINRAVRAVIAALDGEPETWRYDGFELAHTSGIHIWIANSSYGMEITRGWQGPTIWGDVTIWSSVGLSPSHWALYFAAKRWLRRAAPVATASPTASGERERG